MNFAGIAPLVVTVLLAGSPGAVREEAREERPVTIVHADGGDRIDLRIPSRVIGAAVAREADGTSALVLLTAGRTGNREAAVSEPRPICPPASPLRALYRFRLDGRNEDGGTLVSIRTDLPADAMVVASHDLDGDGSDEVLVGRPGAVLVYGPLAGERDWPGPRIVLAEAEAGVPSLWADPAGGTTADILALVPLLGRSRFYRPERPAPAFAAIAEVELSPQVTVSPAGLEVAAPTLGVIGVGADGRPRWAGRAEPIGDERLRVVLADPLAASVAERRLDCWARLPGRERLLEEALVTVDGAPALFVTTMAADRLSLFGEKRLRLYALRPDRSRSGYPPLLAVESRINLWQQAHPRIVDVDGDGREDLVVAYWKGLSDDRIVLDTYTRASDGAFHATPQTTAFDVEEGDRSFAAFGDDVQHDGRPDLLLIGQGRLLVFSGLGPSSARTGIVAVQPAWSVPLRARGSSPAQTSMSVGVSPAGTSVVLAGAVGAAPRVVDLDGDDLAEILFIDDSDDASVSVQVIRLKR